MIVFTSDNIATFRRRSSDNIAVTRLRSHGKRAEPKNERADLSQRDRNDFRQAYGKPLLPEIFEILQS